MWTYTLPSERSVEILNEAGYALFTSPLGATRAMRALLDYNERCAKSWPRGRRAPSPREARDKAARGIWRPRARCSANGRRGRCSPPTASATTTAPCWRSRRPRRKPPRMKLGRPVALKIQSADIPHKTEAGGVALNVAGDDARAAYERVLAAARRHAPTAHIDGVLVQPMARPGREVILGINRDPRWGPLLMVGLGGVLVEALGDIALAPVPLDHDAARCADRPPQGRAAASAPIAARRRPTSTRWPTLMVKLSQFAADHADDIAEIDLNPVIVHAKGEGVTVVDALIVKQPRAGSARPRRGRIKE